MMRKGTLIFRLLVLLSGTVLLALTQADSRFVSNASRVVLVVLAVVGLVWLLVRFLRRFLWRVSRRLAFSYFLIGALPIPLLLLLLGVAAYMLSSFFLGHLFRDAANSLHHDLVVAAEEQLAAFSGQLKSGGASHPDFKFGYYDNGWRVAGDAALPEAWPEWLPVGGLATLDPDRRKEKISPLVATADGTPVLAAAAGGARRGVIALVGGALESKLSERSDVWVRLLRSDEPDARSFVRLSLGTRQYDLAPFRRETATAERATFFSLRGQGSGYVDRPMLVWAEMTGPLRSLADGKELAETTVAALRGTPRTMHRHLFSSDSEVNTSAWVVMIVLFIVLLDIYVVALFMAVYMIFGLSRAVNRLSKATDAVRNADFSVRIPVRRRDQVGELQRSFNEMIAHLQELVASAAQKEALEKELAIARSVQESLLPTLPPTGEAVEFATHFEPSAAIGGDYFDILRVDQNRIAVVIADVSGHGLSAGLRMAMVKGGLQILAEKVETPLEVFSRLDAMLRTPGGQRAMVTATLAVLDVATGTLEITNAGHPPCYLLTAGGVEEIVLPSSALGGLGRSYAQATRRLVPGDTVVWLSDGLIEATNAAAQPFGYDRVVETLAAGERVPGAVRQRLLSAIAVHAAGEPADDDRTLVVMRYVG